MFQGSLYTKPTPVSKFFSSCSSIKLLKDFLRNCLHYLSMCNVSSVFGLIKCAFFQLLGTKI